METATAQLKQQWESRPPITRMVNVCFLMFGTWANDGAMPDQSNLYQASEDALQAAGVLADDRLIDSHTGSRRVPMCPFCPELPVITRGKRKGEKKDTCGKKKKCPYMGFDIIITPASRADIEPLARGRCGPPPVL